MKNDLITAATIQGEVTLSGTVSSAASSELAESIASHVQGVTKVDNSLKVGNPQDAAAPDPNAQQTDNQDYSQAPPPPPPPAAGDGATAGPDQAQQPPYPVQQQAPPPSAYPYPPARPQYAPSQPRVQAYQAPSGPVTIPQGTLLQLRTSEAVVSKRAKDGEPVQFTVIQDCLLYTSRCV